jgi:hypothetical protein
VANGCFEVKKKTPEKQGLKARSIVQRIFVKLTK